MKERKKNVTEKCLIQVTDRQLNMSFVSGQDQLPGSQASNSL